MRKIILALACFQFILIFSNAQTTKPAKGIAGVWRLVEFADFDSASNTWLHRYGKNPKGYFIYTAAGYLSINVSNEKPMKLSEEEAEKFNVNFYEFFSTKAFAYFGTYTFEPEKGSVIHHVKGGSIPWYTDTEQPRQIQLKGDTAMIGDNKTTRRVLVRVE
jgi:Lipocalin-like domain